MTLSRRDVIIHTAVAAATFGAGLAPALARTAGDPLADATTTAEIFSENRTDLYAVAARAYVWGFPLVEAAKIRLHLTRPADPFGERLPSEAGGPINRFGHGRILADPSNKVGVGPNNDTLYSNAAFDLDAGPFVVMTPDFGARYYTFQIALPDSSTIASLGQRTHGAQLPPLFVHGAKYGGPVPEGMIPVTGPDRYLTIFGRTLVEGEDDLPIVRALQDQIRVYRYADGPDSPQPEPTPQRQLATPEKAQDKDLLFLEHLGTVLADMNLNPQDRALVETFGKVGLSPTGVFDLSALSTEQRAEIARGLRDGANIVRRASERLGVTVGGWAINYRGPRFGDDYLLRAAVAKDQIFVTLPEEAIYPNARLDKGGEPLSGKHEYEIRFDGDKLPPVNAFWSITMYNDKGAMVENPIRRYSIGDRTPGLVREADGSIVIRLSHSQPSQAGGNWLPAPQGPFYLMMRLYIPRPKIIERQWAPPGIDKIR